ncbi:hypothetical protein PVAND_015478 [Polypedilum vanderplanki]|uniref:F-box domain-containing protein n=1 Tax=Polypedilum vanderplanki TaxID=319348 RepID=A0A9J6BD86_POLVA|nr:hypothetical protein PVAND_015478 [Polypedilum vanderplanki]
MDICGFLPLEIIEIIFSYLPIKELLNASLVSKSWNNIIGSSEAFKKHSVVNLYHWDWDKNKFPEIKRSSREYEALNIKIFKCKDKDKSVLLNLLKSKNWRKVFFNVSKVSSQKHFVNFIQPLENVKDLSIMNVQIRELNKHNKIILNELESLSFSDIAIDTLYTFMAQQPSLKRLSLRFISSDILSKEQSGVVITNFLKSNSFIRELELNEDVTNDLFKKDITNKVKLSLKSLSIGLNNTESDVKNNLEIFLKSQYSSLEQLEILLQQKFDIRNEEFWWDHERNLREENNDLVILFDVWNDLHSLKFLCLRFMKDKNVAEISPSSYKNLKKNSNIKSLSIRHISRPNLQEKYILAILNLVPNLTSLYITKLTPSLVRVVAYNLKLLRKISYMNEENDAVNEYEALKNTNDESVNKFIKFSVEYLG